MTDTHTETKTKTLYIDNITLYHCALWKSQVFIQTTWVHTCGARLSSRSSSGRGQPSHWGLSRRGGALRGRLLFCGVVFFNQAASQRKPLKGCRHLYPNGERRIQPGAQRVWSGEPVTTTGLVSLVDRGFRMEATA